MKRDLCISLCVSIFMLAFSFYFQILPVLQQIKVTQVEQNHLQIKWYQQKHNKPSNPSLTSTAFYNWMNSQHLPGLALVSLVQTSQGLHLEVSGSKSSIEQFLNLAQDSLFVSLNLSQLNSDKINFDGVFASLQLDTKTRTPADPVQPKQAASAVVGVIHQNGLQFCVMQYTQGVRLVRKDQC